MAEWVVEEVDLIEEEAGVAVVEVEEHQEGIILMQWQGSMVPL